VRGRKCASRQKYRTLEEIAFTLAAQLPIAPKKNAFVYDECASGAYQDKETNLHYSYFRDCYDSGIGRFCQPDPIGTVLFEGVAFRSLGVLGLTKPDLEAGLYSDEPRFNHLYAYVGNTPVSFTDPTGLITAPTASGFPVGAAVPGDPNASQSGSGSNTQVCAISWKHQRWACRESCKAIGRAMGGISGEAYTSRCIMMCNLTYTKP
jgi:RHS repeat-associated protein